MSQVEQQTHDEAFQRVDQTNALTVEQLSYAREIIAKKRPMTDVPIVKVWPWFKHCPACCCKKEQPNFKLALKQALLNKLDMKIPKTDIQLEEDPYCQVGYGINSYFDITVQLAWMFCMISLVMIPTMIMFSHYAGVKDFSTMYYLDQYTMGNMGGASVICNNIPIEIQSIQLGFTCPSGTIDLTAQGHVDGTTIFNYGIISSQVTDKSYCQVSALPDNNPDCMTNNWNATAFKTEMYNKCQGKKSCSIEDLDSFQTQSIMYPMPNGCSSGSAMLFVQLACTYSDQELVDRQIFGLYQACVGVFVALYMIVYSDYIRSVEASNYVEWDVKTITAGDYTIEFDIRQSFFTQFKNEKGKVGNSQIDDNVPFEWNDDKTDAENFRIWIEKQIEFRMSQLPDLKFESEPQDKINVAVTFLAYDNSKLMHLLRDRGSAIITEKWDKMRKIDEQITEAKNENLERWSTPVSVFITFQLEEGYQRAINMENTIKDSADLAYLNEWFNDHEAIEIQPASEPSDILWQNRHFTPRERTRKGVIVFIIIGLVLFGSFIIILIAQKWSYSLMSVYPVVSCDQFNVYPDITLYALASGEFIANEALLDAGQKHVTYSGYVQCYCQKTLNDTSMTTLSPETLPSSMPTIPNYTQTDICTEYFTNVWFVLFMSNFITGFIVVVNTIIKEIAIALITWIGYDTHSEQLTKITNGVFVSLFFNTGFLLVLSNANFSQYRLPFQSTFDGPFDDYSPSWYVYVGNTLTQTMIINAFFQTFFQMGMDVLVWYFRRSDQKWGKTEVEKMTTSKCTQIGQYIRLFQGDPYIVHYKYSMIFNIVFVTMLFGMGIPSLFPIAVIALVVFWMLERYCVAYTYQVPPRLDNRLTKNAFELILKAPLFYMVNGFWMLTNTQIYSGWVNPIAKQGESMLTGHTFDSVMSVNQASPLLLLMVALFFIIMLESYFKDQLTEWGFSLSANLIEVDENLPDFYLAVKLSDADWIATEQLYYNDQYKMKLVEQELADKMDSVGRPTRAISGIAWYNVLANPAYTTAFNYIETNVPDRSNLIVDDDADEGNDNEQSDTIQVSLNLGVLNKDIALGMPFGHGMMAYMNKQLGKKTE